MDVIGLDKVIDEVVHEFIVNAYDEDSPDSLNILKCRFEESREHTLALVAIVVAYRRNAPIPSWAANSIYEALIAIHTQVSVGLDSSFGFEPQPARGREGRARKKYQTEAILRMDILAFGGSPRYRFSESTRKDLIKEVLGDEPLGGKLEAVYEQVARSLRRDKDSCTVQPSDVKRWWLAANRTRGVAGSDWKRLRSRD